MLSSYFMRTFYFRRLLVWKVSIVELVFLSTTRNCKPCMYKNQSNKGDLTDNDVHYTTSSCVRWNLSKSTVWTWCDNEKIIPEQIWVSIIYMKFSEHFSICRRWRNDSHLSTLPKSDRQSAGLRAPQRRGSAELVTVKLRAVSTLWPILTLRYPWKYCPSALMQGNVTDKMNDSLIHHT